MNDLQEKQNYLLALQNIRKKIGAYKYVHVMSHDKFINGIVKFISTNFNPDEHCFVISVGGTAVSIPLPDFPNVYSFPNALYLHDSPQISKFIFHAMYVPGAANILYNSPAILSKSYWVPWGRDIYNSDNDDAEMIYVKKNFIGIAANASVRETYITKYGGKPTFFPYNISYESIPYELIISTPSPQKDYIQILANNSSHETTLEIFDYLQKFRDRNIRVATILSYGEYSRPKELLKKGQALFGDNFIPITKLMEPAQYIKFLAKTDILVLNQHRPQGMTTLFTMMLQGKKIFMRSKLSEYLRQDGYHIYDTQKIPEMDLQEFITSEKIEENRAMAAKRFDRENVKNFWNAIFTHQPGN